MSACSNTMPSVAKLCFPPFLPLYLRESTNEKPLHFLHSLSYNIYVGEKCWVFWKRDLFNIYILLSLSFCKDFMYLSVTWIFQNWYRRRFYVVTSIFKSCYMDCCFLYFLPFVKQNQAAIWPKFQSLMLKLLFWSKGGEEVKVHNALCQLCIWQCFMSIFDFPLKPSANLVPDQHLPWVMQPHKLEIPLRPEMNI